MTYRRPRPYQEENASSGTRPRRVYIALALAGVVSMTVAFAQWPVLDARVLTLDDKAYLVENQLVKHPSWTSAGRFLTEVRKPSTVKGYYQPLGMISLMLDYAVAGRTDNLRPFHRTSLVLHIGNTLLLMGLLYMLFGRPWIVAGVVLLFGVHPMAVEPIAWVGERKTLLAAFFSLLCLLVYVRYARRGGWKSYVICTGLYVLALMSKPTSIPIPLVLLLLDFWPLQRLSKASVVEKTPFLLMAAAFTIITAMSQRHLELVQSDVLTTGQTLLLSFHNLIFYPSKMIWPTNLSSLYPFPENISLSNTLLLTSTVTCLAVVILLLVSLWWTRAVLVGWLCFFLLLAPTLLNKSYSPSVAWDKYAYLPVVGLLMILAWFLTCVAGNPAKNRPRWRPVSVGIGILVAAALLTVGTRKYLQEWSTTERHKFYMRNLAPNSPFTNFGCGNLFKDKGQYERAIPHYSRAITLKPDYLYAYLNRGVAYASIGDYTRAFQDYNKVVELNPVYAEVYNNRGITYQKTHNFDKAIRDYTKAIKLMPECVEAYNNRGVAYIQIHDYDRAIRDFTKAIELMPEYAEAYSNRGAAYNQVHDYDCAIRDFTKAIMLKPDNADAYSNRGITYQKTHNSCKAIHDLTKTIELMPECAQAYNDRGVVYNETHDYDRAIRDFSKAIELKSNDTNAYNNRARAYCFIGAYDKARADIEKCKLLGGQVSPNLIEALTKTSSQPR